MAPNHQLFKMQMQTPERGLQSTVGPRPPSLFPPVVLCTPWGTVPFPVHVTPSHLQGLGLLPSAGSILLICLVLPEGLQSHMLTEPARPSPGLSLWLPGESGTFPLSAGRFPTLLLSLAFEDRGRAYSLHPLQGPGQCLADSRCLLKA